MLSESVWLQLASFVAFITLYTVFLWGDTRLKFWALVSLVPEIH